MSGSGLRSNRNVAHYAAIISKETGLPKWKVHLALMIAWKRVCRALYLGEEVRLKGFGRIYFTKNKLYADGTHHPPKKKKALTQRELNIARGRPWIND